MSQAQLSNATEALKTSVLNQIKNQGMRNRDESVNGIVEYFLFIGFQNREWNWWDEITLLRGEYLMVIIEFVDLLEIYI